MPDRRGDAAISDMLGTLLLVLAVVAAGAAITAIVASNLAKEGAPVASFALATPRAGDTALRVLYRAGEPLALPELSLRLTRGAGPATDVPGATWTTPGVTTLEAGDALSFPVSPAITVGESLRVEIVHLRSNTVVSQLTASLPSSAASFADATLTASLAPPKLIADGASTSLLEVRVSHPAGALAVASVTANVSTLGEGSGSTLPALALNDDGADGDAWGGDGVWSGLLRAPTSTTPGWYEIPISVLDIAGADAGSTSVAIEISTYFAGGGAVEGRTTLAPSSANVTEFLLRNWTYDRSNPALIDGDRVVLRVINGAWSWSAQLDLEYRQGTPGISLIRMWNANASTTYAPTTGLLVSIVGLQLNLTDPTQSGFLCETGCTTPMAYRNASIEGTPGLVIAHLRDASKIDPAETGLYAVDVVMR